MFRKKPQDFPASWLLWKFILIGYIVVGMVLLKFDSDWVDAIEQTAAEVFMMLSFNWIILKWFSLTPRFVQSSSALLSSDALISTLAIPSLMFIADDQEPKQAAYLFLLFLLLWRLAVMAHILRHALSKPLLVGVGCAIGYLFVSYQVMILLLTSNG